MLVNVRSTFSVHGTSDLDTQTDAVIEALLRIESEDSNVCDSDVTAELEARRVQLAVVVEADSFEEADSKGQRVIRRAIEEANGHIQELGEDVPNFLTEAQSSDLVSA